MCGIYVADGFSGVEEKMVSAITQIVKGCYLLGCKTAFISDSWQGNFAKLSVAAIIGPLFKPV